MSGSSCSHVHGVGEAADGLPAAWWAVCVFRAFVFLVCCNVAA